MAYEVLARKWRPQVFEEVVGQDAITKTLKNALEFDRLHHAYVFSGARGVGKTTTARLLAKALNCHKTDGPNPVPCGTEDHMRFLSGNRGRTFPWMSLNLMPPRIRGSTIFATSYSKALTSVPPGIDLRSSSSTRFTCCRSPRLTRC